MAEFLDSVAWPLFKRAVGHHVPRQEDGLARKCVLEVPVDTVTGTSWSGLVWSGLAIEMVCCGSPIAVSFWSVKPSTVENGSNSSTEPVWISWVYYTSVQS